MKKKGNIELKTCKEDKSVSYIYLSNHPRETIGCSKKTTFLRELIPNYIGPDIIFDFNENNEIIGIEILE